MKVRVIIALAALSAATACTPLQVSWFTNLDAGDQRDVTEMIIRSSADEFGVDADLLLGVAVCESGLNVTAKNRSSSARGLFQFLDTTWDSQRHRLDYAPEDILDPVASSRVAASMISEGGLSAWNASRHCWSRVTLPSSE